MKLTVAVLAWFTVGVLAGVTLGSHNQAGATDAPKSPLGKPAPLFSVKTHEGAEFDLASRKGKGWTVLFFYPKAETPGCTKQACAFRDSIDKVRGAGAEVYGISGDTVEDQAKFHKKYRLGFTLLADPDAKVIEAFGAKVPMMKMAKRWTFILDKDLNILSIDKDVDPALDADRVVARIKELSFGK